MHAHDARGRPPSLPRRADNVKAAWHILEEVVKRDTTPGGMALLQVRHVGPSQRTDEGVHALASRRAARNPAMRSSGAFKLAARTNASQHAGNRIRCCPAPCFTSDATLRPMADMSRDDSQKCEYTSHPAPFLACTRLLTDRSTLIFLRSPTSDLSGRGANRALTRHRSGRTTPGAGLLDRSLIHN